MIWLLIMWKAKLYTELDYNSCAWLTINVTKSWERVFQIKVDYDWLTWNYTLRGRNLLLKFIWTDFDKEWRAKCFLKYIYTKDLHTLLCGHVY